jgi:protein gp37
VDNFQVDNSVMADKTGISWAHSTLNYWIGCTKVSAACAGCYAERDWDKRFHRVMWGPHGARTPTKTWRQAYKWQREAAAFFAKHGKKRRVFVNSLSDFADNHPTIKQEWRDAAHKAWKECPDVIFMILTKRPQNLLKPGFLPADWSAENYPNVWIGTTTENQEEADRRIPHLLKIDAEIRFLSCGPLLGALDLSSLIFVEKECPNWEMEGSQPPMDPETGTLECCKHCDYTGFVSEAAVHLVIVEGESGPDARPMHPDWVRSIRDQCDAAGVAFHFKQWGEWAPTEDQFIDEMNFPLEPSVHFRNVPAKDSHWTDDHGWGAVRVGVKRAGRTLDGVIHDAMPS